MGSLQSRAIGTAGRILQFELHPEDNFRVIASEATQSRFCAEPWIAWSQVRPCANASRLSQAMTEEGSNGLITSF
jgi:hypothetical protein